MNKQIQLTIAIFHWGNLIEEFLDTIDISFESFCQEMTGGWLFNYIDALKLKGIKTILFCISGKVEKITYYQHLPTGAKICVLPAPSIYHLIRHPIINPYGWTVKEAIGDVKGLRRCKLNFYRHTLPYLATPLTLLVRELKKENCQAIICQEYEYARFDICVLLGKLTKIPVYATFQGGNFQLSKWEKYLRPLTIKNCQGLIIPTQTEIDRVQNKYHVPKPKIAKIFNPIDVKNWKAIDRLEARKKLQLPLDSQTVVWHGRVDIFRKGLDTLLDAWEIVTKTINSETNQKKLSQKLNLLLVGTGSGADTLQQIIEQKKLTNVIWLNEYILDREKIKTCLSAADLYVLSSRHEGFPVAPIEAMACGLPIVATDAPGIPDILEDGELSGGLMVNRENAIALADAIVKIINNPTLQERLGKFARERVENYFSLEAVSQQLYDFLD